MPLTNERLAEIVSELVSRPGHNKVSLGISALLIDGLGIPSGDITFEQQLRGEVRGRMDALTGNVVFEYKSDLRAERAAAEEELTRYLRERRAESERDFIGIATDGTAFVTYELRDDELRRLGDAFIPSAERSWELLNWLDTALSVRGDLAPTPVAVARELGRSGLAYQRARTALLELWSQVGEQPDVRLKRELWADLLQRVYGSRINDDDLFIQHTYLTIVAKTMAVQVMGMALPSAPDLLSGKPFAEASIAGAIESDFFDWLLDAEDGAELVLRVAHQVQRFQLSAIESDVLKVLYESLIDPQQRHDLGEFYTPDWLADLMCEQAITDPLEQRVLDPSCGSGTFPFFAVRRLLAAADEAGLDNKTALTKATTQVIGLDIHPVAVIVARVNFLLALGTDRLQQDRPAMAVPIYLGDALQWNTQQFLAEKEVLIQVPDDGPILFFPYSVTRDPTLFDQVIAQMLALSERQAEPPALVAWLKRQGVRQQQDLTELSNTYASLRQLQAEDRNHIWGYVARNLSRPIWLSGDEQRVDVVIGNPPWLAYHYMSADFQARFREQCEERGIWVGGKLATHQDLSALFFVRAVELYLKGEGSIAFVMPFAALSRGQFTGFRTGNWRKKKGKRGVLAAVASVEFDQPWAFDERVQPLFPVPASVIFARNSIFPTPLPPTTVAFAGELPRRDASRAEAEKHLTYEEIAIAAMDDKSGGDYRERFRQGATVTPRMLAIVEPVQAGMLGGSASLPLVESRRSRLEKKPWRDMPPMRAQIERQFLRPLYLGENIAPYRVLDPYEAVIAWGEEHSAMLTAAAAADAGYPHLSAWLERAEKLWEEHGGGMPYEERINYHGSLASQFPIAPIRVVYAKAGTLPASAVIRNPEAAIDHSLYWAAASEEEARYLTAILNSETARAAVRHLQARGQWGARHFDKVMLTLPIPTYSPSDEVHVSLVEMAKRAEEIAGAVPAKGVHFIRLRGNIRQALADDGVDTDINARVARLLGIATA